MAGSPEPGFALTTRLMMHSGKTTSASKPVPLRATRPDLLERTRVNLRLVVQPGHAVDRQLRAIQNLQARDDMRDMTAVGNG